jgi:hypothetical protein
VDRFDLEIPRGGETILEAGPRVAFGIQKGFFFH